MKALEALKDEDFRKVLDSTIKGFIDEAMAKTQHGVQVPKNKFPLEYEHKELNQAVGRMRKGAELGLSVYDRYMAAKGKQ